jgi:hypothetical protein
MCTGIAITISEVPHDVATDPRLANRLYDRDGRQEMRFLWWQKPSNLPVQWNGQLRILPWGNRRRDRGGLPTSGWISRDELQLGMLAHAKAEDVVIPCQLAINRGTWFLVVDGIRRIVAKDGEGKPVVYMLTEPSSNYYRNMTEQEPMMPVLIGQVI